MGCPSISFAAAFSHCAKLSGGAFDENLRSTTRCDARGRTACDCAAHERRSMLASGNKAEPGSPVLGTASWKIRCQFLNHNWALQRNRRLLLAVERYSSAVV